jgi:hypothetical protein
MEGGRRRKIVGIAATAADERIVFLAKHALAYAKFDGSHPVTIPLRVATARSTIERPFEPAGRPDGRTSLLILQRIERRRKCLPL